MKSYNHMAVTRMEEWNTKSIKKIYLVTNMKVTYEVSEYYLFWLYLVLS